MSRPLLLCASVLAGCATQGTLQVPDVSSTAAPPPPADSPPPPPPAEDCPPVTAATRAVVVTDIDETLTTSDNEWLTQIALPGTDPEMRPEADRVMKAFVARGYRVIYVSARGEGLRLLDGTTAREATEAWLTAHDFPFTSEGVILAPGLAAFGGEAADYKTEILAGLQADGAEVHFAYGNADTDIEAYQNAGIPDDRIFLVGKLAGRFGVEPIPTDQAYAAHLPKVEQFVPCAPVP